MFREYKGYRINKSGIILGVSGKNIKGTKNSKGYLQTTGKNKKKYLIHRLIAECWIDCPGDFNYYQVNHIDGNKLNNSITNLEWVTPTEHIRIDNNRRINEKNIEENNKIAEKVFSINYII
tara:strand:- start:616 stop:978 length:363 start_codon:yes stop_codon:yes gene_type:complete